MKIEIKITADVQKKYENDIKNFDKESVIQDIRAGIAKTLYEMKVDSLKIDYQIKG